MPKVEEVVFVDESGEPTGEIGPKLAGHAADTKLHLAFSCYILRRGDNKATCATATTTQRKFGQVFGPIAFTVIRLQAKLLTTQCFAAPSTSLGSNTWEICDVSRRNTYAKRRYTTASSSMNTVR